MPLNPVFHEELHVVDASRTFSEVIDPSYDENEWSVTGWELRAGSDAALEHAASEAMYRLGFRWFTPYSEVRPGTLPQGGVTLPKQQFAFPHINVLVNYGFGPNDNVKGAFDRWATLMCVKDDRRPHGHVWESIIKDNAAHFNANRDHWIDLVDNSVEVVEESTNALSFVLDNATARASNLAICVSYLRTVMTAESREIARFDADDGDRWDSDTIFGFANDVAAELRATTHPNAVLNLYAYAGHRAPPSFNCPHLGVQVALGFNDLGLGYPELVRRWGLVCPRVDLRGYGDVAAQKGFLPCNSGIVRREFFTGPYREYVAAGANGLNMETSTNWAINIVSHWHMIRFCRYPTHTYSDARDEVVTHVFDGDPKATEFFDVLGDPLRKNDAFTRSLLCEIVDQMQAGPTRTALERYLTICQRHMELTGGTSTSGFFNNRPSTMTEGKYFSLLESVLRNAAALEETGELHYYSYVRQMANANTSNNGRADLSFSNQPHYQRFPQASSPEDFQAVRQQLRRETLRPSALVFETLDDLVLVDVTPKGIAAANQSAAEDFYTEGGARFVVWNDTAGPITVTHSYENENFGSVAEDYPPGVHWSEIDRNATTTWSGGKVFLLAFPSVRMDPSVGGQRWAYLPKNVQGKYRLTSASRLTIFAENGRFDISSETPQGITPGVVRVDRVNTRGVHRFINVCPFISPLPDKMLMPRALSDVEFPGRVVIG